VNGRFGTNNLRRPNSAPISIIANLNVPILARSSFTLIGVGTPALLIGAEVFGRSFQKLRTPGDDLIGVNVELLGHSASVFSPVIAVGITAALKSGL
jgi:hypothetical protein